MSKINKILIKDVVKYSIADELNIKSGYYLLSINNQQLVDIMDYKFLVSDEYIELEVENLNGEIEIFEIEKDESEDLGLVFESELIDEAKSCYNKCVFCFMEQLPPNVRPTLVFKDDDYRLSFFSGNYITMTNMKEADIDRIIKYRISPINISIHTTDEQTRIMMLNNKNAGKVLKYIDKLYENNIDMNFQIVLCKDLNDGEILRKTIRDLSKYADHTKSICIVPVGLSKYRKNLYELKPLLQVDCEQVIEDISNFQKEFKKKYGSRLVYIADEFYIKAKHDMPEYKEYEDFPQLENGVGMVSLFEHEFNKEIKKLEKKVDYKLENRVVTVVTGKIIEEYLKKKASVIENIVSGLKINIVGIDNNYFGENITVTGLVVGQDIKKKLLTLNDLGDYVIVPNVMLKEDENIFLDDTTLDELSKSISKKIIVSDTCAKGFINAIIKKK